MALFPFWSYCEFMDNPRRIRSCRLKTNPYWRPESGSNSRTYEISLNIHPFQAEELSIKVDNDLITVIGEQNNKEEEYGTITRYYKRSFFLPENYNKDGIQSKLSSDNVLTITVPIFQSPSRRIPILFTGAPLNRDSPSAKAA